MADFPPYIVPIGYYKNNEATYLGTGFIVKNHLITAAHVVRDVFCSKPFALINKKAFFIGPLNCKYFFNDLNEKTHYDFAVISLSVDPFFNPKSNNEDFIVDSPLFLSDRLPLVGDKVINKFLLDKSDIYYYEEKDNEVCDFPYYLPEDKYSKWDNYFYIRHKGKITHGSSGSPVLIGNEVIGMVTNGLDEFSIEDYHLPSDYLFYCDCIQMSLLKKIYPNLFE